MSEEMDALVARAKMAQQAYMNYTQEQVDEIVKQVANAAYEASTHLAKLAVEETGMGVWEHKKLKNELGSMGVYESIKHEKTVGIITENQQEKITEIAYPYGVIACIIPTTNPTSTALFKTLIALKTGNAVIVSPHPNAVRCTIEALRICQEAAIQAGAPEGLIGWISEPSLEKTNILMKHRDVHLILATGGSGLVRAAYSSGKPAYGVGPGNVPVYIDKSANVKEAVKMIMDSKTFDNGTICATEQAMVVHRNIKQMVVRELKLGGAYFLHAEEKSKLERIISLEKGKLNPQIVGQPALRIAEMAGITVPGNTRLLIAEENRVGKDVPFSMEKLSPIFGLYTARDEEDAIHLCRNLLNLGGRGHSFSIHAHDDAVTKKFAEMMPVSRVLVNTLASIGAAGATTSLTPSFTLGCGAYGGNITADNITAKHLINIKRVAHGVKEVTIPKPSTSNATHRMAGGDTRIESHGISAECAVYQQNGGFIGRTANISAEQEKYQQNRDFIARTANISAEQEKYRQNRDYIARTANISAEQEKYQQNGGFIGRTANISAEQDKYQQNRDFIARTANISAEQEKYQQIHPNQMDEIIQKVIQESNVSHTNTPKIKRLVKEIITQYQNQ